MTKPLAFTFALALATPACAEVVALDGADSAPVVASDKEGVVANLHERPDLLVVDGDRLYWAGLAFLDFAGSTTLRSCRKVDCARSVIAYATAPYMAWLEVADGEVYFRPLTAELAQRTQAESSVLSCPTSGCTGDPRVVVEAADAFTIADDSIFFGSSSAEVPGIYEKPRWGGDATLVVAVSSPLRRILVRDDQLFWWTTGHALQRTSSNGDRRVETLFEEPGSPWGFSLTSDAEAAYWSPNELTSDIERCPLVGCPTGPEVVAAPVRMPSSLFVSDGRLYFNVELESSDVGLVSCLPFACANPRLLGVATARGVSTIATDERFVYAFSNQGFRRETQSLPADLMATTSGKELSSLRRYEK